MMTRRTLLGSLAAPALTAAAARPNVVFILADDLGHGDLSCYNAESRIQTPQLDALAKRGVRFTNAHTPSAVCTPTRYGLMTGRYAWRTRLKRGVLDGLDPSLIEAGRTTMASLLKGSGYATACVGKWHLGMDWTRRDGSKMPFRPDFNGGFRDGRDVDYTKPIGGGPRAAGFDYYFGISASLDMSPYCFIENDRVTSAPSEPTPDRKDLFLNQSPGVTPPGFDLRSVLPESGKKACEFIAKQKGTQKPFFLYMPLSAPHLPIVPNPEFEGRSKAGRYGDFVVEMDHVVGQVLAALKANGFERDTLVFFSSDNGGLWHWWEFEEADDVKAGKTTPRGKYVKDYGHQSNGHLRGTKADLWEGGHRVPLLVSWPARSKKALVNERLVCLTDVIRTVADLCSLPLPQDAAEDSISMAGHLFGGVPKGRVRTDIVTHSVRGEFAIQKDNWKLILKRGSGGFSAPQTVAGEPAGQLYDMAKDPRETKNVYAEHPDVVASLAALLERYRSEGRSA